MIEEIKALARNLGLNPSALSGQNFLIDEKVLAAIVAAAEIKKQDNILEIGPGFGTLTEKLLPAKRVLAVERDKKLCQYLAGKLRSIHNLEIINTDILALSNQAIARRFNSESYRIIANIPYGITGKIMRKFISDIGPKPRDMVILAQKEVGERICASNKKNSLLSLSVNAYARPKIAFFVRKSSFWPIPKVDSVLLKIEKISEKEVYPIRDIRMFWRIVRIGFSSPRKQIHNNLTNGLKLSKTALAEALKRAGIAASWRAEDVSLEQWVKLANDEVGNLS